MIESSILTRHFTIMQFITQTYDKLTHTQYANSSTSLSSNRDKQKQQKLLMRPLHWMTNRLSLRVLGPIALLAIFLSGCGAEPAEEPQVPLSMRAPQPTFTPTAAIANAPVDNAVPKEPIVQVADNAITDNATTNSSTANSANSRTATGGAVSPDEAAAVVISSANSSIDRIAVENGGSVIVDIQLLNGRAGPGAEYDLVGIVGKGEFFDIIGRNTAGDWWEVCCYLDTPFWVADEFVNVRGSSTGQAAPVVPTPVPPISVPATAASPTAVPAAVNIANQPASQAAASAVEESAPQAGPKAAESEFDFALKATEQFPETNVVRIFLYAFQNGQALPGFSLKVLKNGAELVVNETSFGPNGGFTWPVESARQRFQNMKVEFPDQSADGTWAIQLVDGSSNPVGPVATFELAADEEEQEMYVRYEQK